ncbi:hypothetical protein [Campylobacter cuniculorum]|uniref:Coiled-coil domain-containing protein n=2 Tax=Campylobacter cuniculorum TaxID=374106 RepID=A0A1W6BV35_9BACT|nr:hypothetical protein [Campylobacter cuniculorum]ARJ55917.1 hypothetical protein CCUN_0262 [Campylobacter cuniculorum DSM 23162 = LMG 24588]QOR05135.1 Coiled-coil domain-containing protein [Campylobacter cuniculorum]
MDREKKEFIDPFSTQEDEAALKALESEIAQASQSLESDFAKFASGKIDERMEELFFENKEEFFKQVLQWQNEFLGDYRSKIQKRDALNNDIQIKKSFSAIEAAQKAFEEAHPDVDVEELLDFYQQDLPPRLKNELDKAKPQDFFELLLEYFSKASDRAQNAEKQEQTGLPKRLEGTSSGVQENDSGDDLVTNRY